MNGLYNRDFEGVSVGRIEDDTEWMGKWGMSERITNVNYQISIMYGRSWKRSIS